MRVTNEQAKALIGCGKRPSCKGCSVLVDKVTCKAGNQEDYAADLLEARELIKEMRESVSNIKNTPWLEVSDNTAKQMVSILEKSKEYAK